MDQSVTRTQYDAGTIRKFKRMCGVAALLMVLRRRGDRTGGVVECRATGLRPPRVCARAAPEREPGQRPAQARRRRRRRAKIRSATTLSQAIDLTLVFGSLYGATIIGAGVIALSGNVILPLSIIWALVAIGVEAPNSPAGAKYTRAAVKYTALILAAKLAALAAFALKVGPELGCAANRHRSRGGK